MATPNLSYNNFFGNSIKKIKLPQLPSSSNITIKQNLELPIYSNSAPTKTSNRILTISAKSKTYPQLRIALCAIAKKENLYIREWVEYYKNIGIKKIFLYDNNELDGEHFEDVINDYITDGFVEVIDKRGIEKGLVYDEQGINLLTSCYIDCYENRCTDFDWVAFFDIDEFLAIRRGNLNNLLCSYGDNIGTVVIPWQHYDDNGLLEYDIRNVVDRFTKISKISLSAGKSIVRIGHELRNKLERNVIHVFNLKDMQTVWVNGEDITTAKTAKKEFNWYVLSKNYLTTAKAILKHYRTKSAEEFLFRHFKRHWGTSKYHTEHERNIQDCLKQYNGYNYINSNTYNIFNNYDPDVYNKKYEYYIKLKTFNKLKVYDAFNKYINELIPINSVKAYNNEPYIISLTSWKGRINRVPFAIWNIHDMCPEAHIVLTLSSEEFTNKLADLPTELLKMYNNNTFEILWTGKNTKTLKKIFHTIKKYRDVPIISADDDCIYLCNYAKELYDYMIANNSLVVRYNMFNKKDTWQFTEGLSTIYNPKMYNVFIDNWWTFYKENMYCDDDLVYTKLCKKCDVHIDHIYRGHTFCFIYDDESDAIHDWSENYDYINCYID